MTSKLDNYPPIWIDLANIADSSVLVYVVGTYDYMYLRMLLIFFL